MKRERCLKYAENNLKEAHIRRDLIETIPLNIPLEFEFRTTCKPLWHWKLINLVGEIVDFNVLSLRCRMIAVEVAGAYPFDRDETCRNRGIDEYTIYPLAFKKIEGWKPYELVDLPLLIGWPNRYNRLAQLLKGT